MRYSDDDLSDLKHELRRRRPSRCHDGLCGAEDCDRCFPGGADDEDEDEDEEGGP